jgi:hypothetical protein
MKLRLARCKTASDSDLRANLHASHQLHTCVKLDLAAGKPEMYDGHGMMVLSRWQSQAPPPFRPSLLSGCHRDCHEALPVILPVIQPESLARSVWYRASDPLPVRPTRSSASVSKLDLARRCFRGLLKENPALTQLKSDLSSAPSAAAAVASRWNSLERQLLATHPSPSCRGLPRLGRFWCQWLAPTRSLPWHHHDASDLRHHSG